MNIDKDPLTESEEFLLRDNEEGQNGFIRVSKGKIRNKICFDVRTYYVDRDGELCPANGATIPIKFAQEVAEAILGAAGFVTTSNLVNRANIDKGDVLVKMIKRGNREEK